MLQMISISWFYARTAKKPAIWLCLATAVIESGVWASKIALTNEMGCEKFACYFILICCFYCFVYKLAMPIYEYRCEACGQEKEFLQKFSDPLKVDCPACGKPTLVKKVTAAGFQLKGSGWYATDFRNNGGKPAPNTAASTSDSSSSETAPQTTGTDAKPAAPAVSTPAVGAPASASASSSSTTSSSVASSAGASVASKKAD